MIGAARKCPKCGNDTAEVIIGNYAKCPCGWEGSLLLLEARPNGSGVYYFATVPLPGQTAKVGGTIKIDERNVLNLYRDTDTLVKDIDYQRDLWEKRYGALWVLKTTEDDIKKKSSVVYPRAGDAVRNHVAHTILDYSLEACYMGFIHILGGAIFFVIW
jgi:hypothetical protein